MAVATMEYHLFSSLPHPLCDGKQSGSRGWKRDLSCLSLPTLFRSLIADHSRSRHCLTPTRAAAEETATQTDRQCFGTIHPFRKPRPTSLSFRTVHLGSQFWFLSTPSLDRPEQQVKGFKALGSLAWGSRTRRQKSTTYRHPTFKQDVNSAW
jgi:hypothetical protein